MRLGDEFDYVTLSAEQETPGERGGDVVAGVRVRCADFSAAIAVFVTPSDWQAFITSLSELEKTRRGEAVLKSAEGFELCLRIHAVGSAGHMAVTGHLERRDLLGGPRLTFEEIPFDPTLLPGLFAELAPVLQS